MIAIGFSLSSWESPFCWFPLYLYVEYCHMCFFIYGDELYMTFLYWPVDTVNYIDCFWILNQLLLHFQEINSTCNDLFNVAGFNLLKLFYVRWIFEKWLLLDDAVVWFLVSRVMEVSWSYWKYTLICFLEQCVRVVVISSLNVSGILQRSYPGLAEFSFFIFQLELLWLWELFRFSFEWAFIFRLP